MIKLPLPIKEMIMQKAAAGAMGRSAGAAGVASDAAVQWSKNLSKVRQASWEAGRDMFENMSLINFDKGRELFSSMRSFFEQFGVISAMFAPFMKLFEVFDSALMKEFSDVIVDLNQLMLNEDMIQGTHNLAAGIRAIYDSKCNELSGLLFAISTAATAAYESVDKLVGSLEDLTDASEENREENQRREAEYETGGWHWLDIFSSPQGGYWGGMSMGRSRGGGSSGDPIKKILEGLIP